MELYGVLAAVAGVASLVAGVYMWVRLRALSVARRVSIALIPAVQAAMTAYAAWGVWQLGAQPEFSITASALALLCAALEPLLFRDVVVAERQELAEAHTRMLEEQLEAQAQHMRDMAEADERVRAVRELMATYFLNIAAAIEQGDARAAQRLVSDATHELPARGTSYCRNPALDALLASKARACAAAEIRLLVQASVPVEAGVRDVELCAIVANLLDDAMAQCSALPLEQRRIVCGIGAEHGVLRVLVERSAAEDGLAAASVARALAAGVPGSHGAHGWNMAAVRAVARRLGGSVLEAQDGDTSIACVMVPQAH